MSDDEQLGMIIGLSSLPDDMLLTVLHLLSPRDQLWATSTTTRLNGAARQSHKNVGYIVRKPLF